MRKYGLGFMIFGGALGAVLFALRCSGWYRSASLQTYSEPAQFVEAAFWACVVTLLLGFVFFLLSLRKPKEQEEPQEEEYGSDKETFEEDFGDIFDEAYEDAHTPSQTQPFDFDICDPAPQPESVSEPTRRVDGWACSVCGLTNPDFSSVCALCGAERGSAPE